MKLLRQGIALAVVGTGIAVTPLLQAAAEPVGLAPDSGNVVQQMRDEAGGKVAVSTEPATGRVGFIRARGNTDLMPSVEGASSSAAVAKATAYVTTFAKAFGATADQLTRSDVSKNRYGWTVTFHQSYRGVPVFGAELRANVDSAGDLTAVNGFAAPVSGLSTTPSRSAAAAAARAIATVRALPVAGARRGQGDATVDTSGLSAEANDLVVYRTGSTRGIAGRSILAYTVVVTNKADIREMVILDANTLKVANRWSLVDSGLERHLYEAAGSSDPSTFTEVWSEGDPFPGSLDIWQANEVDYTGDAYWLFANTFGRDSYDALGHSMTTVNNDGRINCPNANWNGFTTNYCDGTATDDVIAHEWGHAYTEYTGNMIYQWQPGALNESMSDVWGETVDLINGKGDDGEGDTETKRPDGQCSTHSPASPIVVINSPSTIAKDCEAGAASFGPQVDATGITGDVVVGIDDDPNDGSATNACTPLTNGAEVTGKIALVDRGTCAFTIKVKNAQDAGAVAVLVADNVEASPGPMSGADVTITIPSVRIRLSDGDLIKGALATEPVNVTMKDSAGQRVDSYRWLIGEQATAFNGAIRDMWTPTCYGDPGKVSDAEYYCATDDAGGVHSNSGVPNHAYALAVDGGTYNGVTVAGLGLDKAANLWWRAESAYLTPTSDFADMADALTAACTDLTGQTINKVSVVPDAYPTAAESIEASDCTELAKVIAAVEMRADPVQCDFQPLLAPNAPDVCGTGTKRKAVFTEDFEDGLAGWTATENVVYAGGRSFPWEATTSAPGGHAGGVAYGPDPDTGDCSGSVDPILGTDDISGSNAITSAPITLPAGELKTPRLSFDHYVATEFGWDGGNVKIKVNDGAFEAVPYTAYTFNEPWYLNFPGQGNTNPMAGEDAFTGTDGGKVTGSWGQSQIDLEALGITGGDTIEIRLDFGRDGCGGLDGWYVDNVTVSLCKVITRTSVKVKPNPVRRGKHFVAQVKVSSSDPMAAEGKVKLYKGSRFLGKAQLVNGRAWIKVTKRLAPGRHRLKAVYTGTPGYFNPSSGSVWLRVRR